MEESIKTLIQKAQSGNREAYGAIYKLYYKKIFRYCSFNTHDKEAAADICQEAFVKAWKKINDFRMDSADWSFQAFLFAIARNLIIDRSREKKEYSLDAHEDIETNEDYYNDFDKKNDVVRIKNALSKLNEAERQIIIFKYFEEMDSKEVANILNINHGALRVRQSRILQKLKDIMEVLYERGN